MSFAGLSALANVNARVLYPQFSGGAPCMLMKQRFAKVDFDAEDVKDLQALGLLYDFWNPSWRQGVEHCSGDASIATELSPEMILWHTEIDVVPADSTP